MEISDKLMIKIFANYPNAKVDTGTFICRQVGLSYETAELVLRATGGVVADAFIHPAKDCKLILSHLSDISNEDALWVAKLTCQPGRQDVFHGRLMLTNMGVFKTEIVIQLMDFLRSKSYDFGYGDIPSLIEAGIATKA